MMNLTATPRSVRADAARRNSKGNRKPAAAPRPRLSWAMTAAVVSLQGGLLLTLAITTIWEPPKVRAIESLWVWVQQVSLAPWLMLLVGGPALSWLACRLDRRRLGVLAVSWAIFGVTLVMAFGTEAQAMLRWMSRHWLG